MPPIRFTTMDADILYCIPKPPVSLPEIVRYYVFINRAGVPRYEELQGCLSRALDTGVLRRVGKKFVVDEKWYEIVHAADGIAENEIESMLEFEEWLTKREFPAVVNAGYHLSRGDYQLLVDSW